MENQAKKQKGVLKAEIKEAFRSSDFRKAFFTNLLWLTAFYTSSPFNTSYQIKELNLPFTFIMLVGFSEIWSGSSSLLLWGGWGIVLAWLICINIP